MSSNQERRRYVRREIDIEGVIVLPDDRRLTCRIMDISETGALIALETPETLPHRFMLQIERPVPVYRYCERTRQEGAMIGVWFPNRPQTVP